MPFKSQGRDFYKTRITLPDGRSGVFGCGTSDLPTANAIEGMVRTLKRKGTWRPLELVVLRKAKLPQLFYAFELDRLDDFVADFERVDLSPLVDEWDGGAKYKAQVRRFIPSDERFGAERFTTRNISLFLKGLSCSGSTKVRYRAALSVFANYLVEIEAIPFNPVREVKAAKANEPREVWLSREQAKALIFALEGRQRAMEALMAATGVEWQVIERLKRRDVDLEAKTVHAQGGKTPWRNRVVRPTEAWAWSVFADYARDCTPSVLLFEGLRHSAALRTHKRIGKQLGLPASTLHDWRHTYAVLSLKAGYSPQIVAHQLGHRDSYLVLTRYGRHVPSEDDYVRRTHAAVPSFQAEGREERASS